MTIASFDGRKLIDEARSSTGLVDFGGDSFRDGLDHLTLSLESEAELTPQGRFVARDELLRYLQIRLQLADWHERFREIREQPIERPIVIIGMGRSGTTILHELLTLDPANRVPLWWEVDSPFPPPSRETFETDPRIARIQQEIDRFHSLAPQIKSIHRMGATLPQECIRITCPDFRSMGISTAYAVPSYTDWLLNEADMSGAYDVHRRTLQLLQWRCPRERWVLKTPAHLWCLDALLAEYPDALLVQTHRDPVLCLSSVASMSAVVRQMTSDRVELPRVAREWSRWTQLACDRSVSFRERGFPSSRIIDLYFADFVADPVSQVRRIYDHFGIELYDDVVQRMRDYIDDNPSDRDGRHAHRFEDTGLDLSKEREKLKRYQEYFDVRSEGMK